MEVDVAPHSVRSRSCSDPVAPDGDGSERILEAKCEDGLILRPEQLDDGRGLPRPPPVALANAYFYTGTNSYNVTLDISTNAGRPHQHRNECARAGDPCPFRIGPLLRGIGGGVL